MRRGQDSSDLDDESCRQDSTRFVTNLVTNLSRVSVLHLRPITQLPIVSLRLKFQCRAGLSLLSRRASSLHVADPFQEVSNPPTPQRTPTPGPHLGCPAHDPWAGHWISPTPSARRPPQSTLTPRPPRHCFCPVHSLQGGEVLLLRPWYLLISAFSLVFFSLGQSAPFFFGSKALLPQQSDETGRASLI